MKLARFTPLIAIAALCFALPAGAQQVAKVATVNAAKVFQEIQETKDLKSKMENDQKTLQAQDLEKNTKIKDLQSARDALKPDAPQYDKANQDLMQAAIDYKVWQQIQGAHIAQMQKQQMLAIFNKITTAVSEVATAKALDLVIAEQKPEIPDNLDAISVDELRMRINQRNVLFSNPAVDVSNDVIAAMDAKYKSGK
jgi:Skp family chaperone for outer membrane proteins